MIHNAFDAFQCMIHGTEKGMAPYHLSGGRKKKSNWIMDSRHALFRSDDYLFEQELAKVKKSC